MYKLLYVDDEELMRDCIYEAVKWEEYGILPVGAAENGMQAMKIAMAEKPDIVVTDIMMPHMDGLELTRELKAILPGTRIIILSGYDDFTYAQKAIEYKVTAYILKPFVPQNLIDAVVNAAAEIDSIFDEIIRNNRDYIHASRFEEISELLTKSDFCKDKLAIEHCKSIIDNNYMKESLCLNIIADQIHLCPGYLGQLFKRSTGESISNYLTSVRIKHAYELLVTTEKKLHEIALEVGYKDEFYLSNVFKKHYGIRPSDVRTIRRR